MQKILYNTAQSLGIVTDLLTVWV